MAPFYRVFANTLGNGPWFDTIIQNIPPVPAGGLTWTRGSAGRSRIVTGAVVGGPARAGRAVHRAARAATRSTLTASFPRTVSIYEGSAVRILGVTVGQVDSVEPAGTTVKVEMSYDGEVRGAGRRQGRRDRAVGRRRPVRPADPGLREGREARGRRRARPRQHRGPARARPDLPEPRRPRRRPRPDRRQQGGRAHAAARRRPRANFGGQGEQFNETIRNLSQFTGTLDNNKEALFATAARSSGSSRRSPTTTRPCATSTTASPPRPACWRTSATTSPPRCATSASRWRQVSAFVKENRDGAVAEHQGPGPGHRSPGQAARRARRDAQRRAARARQPVPHLQPERPARSTPAPTSARTSTTLADRPGVGAVLAGRARPTTPASSCDRWSTACGRTRSGSSASTRPRRPRRRRGRAHRHHARRARWR